MSTSTYFMYIWRATNVVTQHSCLLFYIVIIPRWPRPAKPTNMPNSYGNKCKLVDPAMFGNTISMPRFSSSSNFPSQEDCSLHPWHDLSGDITVASPVTVLCHPPHGTGILSQEEARGVFKSFPSALWSVYIEETENNWMKRCSNELRRTMCVSKCYCTARQANPSIGYDWHQLEGTILSACAYL
jgi:hypothetical protein